jgi:hypothetical protein
VVSWASGCLGSSTSDGCSAAAGIGDWSLAVVFIVVAVIYLAEPAKSLPSFTPGTSPDRAGTTR